MKFFNFLFSNSNRSTDLSKFLIVGIGNVGTKYLKTRHNLGFEALDQISNFYESRFEKEKLGEISKFSIKGRSVILLKPNTYVNLSGKSVRYWLNKEKINMNNLIIICDDINIPFGKIRIRSKGSDGGHNGLKSITEQLKTTNYNRLRFGIGSNFKKINQSDYVLSEWSDSEKSKLLKLMPDVKDAVCSFILSGVNFAMNKYNS